MKRWPILFGIALAWLPFGVLSGGLRLTAASTDLEDDSLGQRMLEVAGEMDSRAALKTVDALVNRLDMALGWMNKGHSIAPVDGA